MRSDAVTHPETDADPRPAAHDLVAGLVEDALAVGEDLRAHSADPVLHAAVEALTAARDLLGLAAGDDTDTDDAAVPTPSPGRRDAVLRDALDSIRAASTAIRFALVEEGDRQRARRARPEDAAWR